MKAVVTVYVYKGVHHYLQCLAPDLVTLGTSVICNRDLLWICANPSEVS